MHITVVQQGEIHRTAAEGGRGIIANRQAFGRQSAARNNLTSGLGVAINLHERAGRGGGTARGNEERGGEIAVEMVARRVRAIRERERQMHCMVLATKLQPPLSSTLLHSSPCEEDKHNAGVYAVYVVVLIYKWKHCPAYAISMNSNGFVECAITDELPMRTREIES